MAVFAKISILILLLELVHYTTNFFASQAQADYLIQGEGQDSLFNFSWTFTLLVSSVLSLIIGAVLGLTQFRIKRLYAYSTISHIGFILLALTVNSIESIQSFIFYVMQYSLTNLNAFIILITIGYSLYLFVEKRQDNNAGEAGDSGLKQSSLALPLTSEIKDLNNSPIQLISQMKGYFYINPFLALSLAITVFSFVGIPPLVGFFAKQMVLSSALDNGYVFMALIAILASVVSAYYYLAIVKQIFFHKTDYILNPVLENITLKANITNLFAKKANSTLAGENEVSSRENITVKVENIKLSSSLTTTISILTLIILFFIFIPQEWLNMANILALILFNC